MSRTRDESERENTEPPPLRTGGGPSSHSSQEEALARLYRRSALVFMAAMVLLFSLAYILPQWLSERARLRDELSHRAEIRAIQLQAAIRLCELNMQALGSRTQIRKALKDYSEGAMDLAALRDYTQSRYEDGARVYPDLIRAVRLGPAGELVAAHGQSPSGVELPTTIPGDHPSTTVGIHPVILPSGEILVCVSVPIVEGGARIGADLGLFDIGTHLAADTDGIRLALVPPLLEGPGAAPFPQARPLGDTGLWHTASWDPELERPKASRVLPVAFGLLTVNMITMILLGRASIFAGSRRILAALDRAVLDRDLALREANHRIKNNLALVSGAINLRGSDPRAEPARELLQDLFAQIQSIASVHELLQGGCLSGTIGLGVFARRVVSAVMEALDPGKRILYSIDGENPSVAVSDATRIGLILNELVTNAVKHGSRSARVGGPQISVLIGFRPDGGFDLAVSNQGPTIPEDKDPLRSDSLGMFLVREYARNLDASVRFLREPRTTFVVSFPPSTVARERPPV